MSCLKPGCGRLSKHGSQLFEGHFKHAETYPVADTQRDFSESNPAVVAVEEYTIAGIVVPYGYPSIITQFNIGMQWGECRVLQDQVT